MHSAQQIIQILLKSGFKQEVIAMAAKVHQSTVSRILSGKHKRVRCSTYARIFDLLKGI